MAAPNPDEWIYMLQCVAAKNCGLAATPRIFRNWHMFKMALVSAEAMGHRCPMPPRRDVETDG
jgi:hypothetical protein